MASVERLASRCGTDPARVGLSATCRPAEAVARFLVGPGRSCRVVEAPMPEGEPAPEIAVESLISRDEAPHRALHLSATAQGAEEGDRGEPHHGRLRQHPALTEKITHDLKRTLDGGPDSVAAHHSASTRRGVARSNRR